MFEHVPVDVNEALLSGCWDSQGAERVCGPGGGAGRSRGRSRWRWRRLRCVCGARRRRLGRARRGRYAPSAVWRPDDAVQLVESASGAAPCRAELGQDAFDPHPLSAEPGALVDQRLDDGSRGSVSLIANERRMTSRSCCCIAVDGSRTPVRGARADGRRRSPVQLRGVGIRLRVGRGGAAAVASRTTLRWRPGPGGRPNRRNPRPKGPGSSRPVGQFTRGPAGSLGATAQAALLELQRVATPASRRGRRSLTISVSGVQRAVQGRLLAGRREPARRSETCWRPPRSAHRSAISDTALIRWAGRPAAARSRTRKLEIAVRVRPVRLERRFEDGCDGTRLRGIGRGSRTSHHERPSVGGTALRSRPGWL